MTTAALTTDQKATLKRLAREHITAQDRVKELEDELKTMHSLVRLSHRELGELLRGLSLDPSGAARVVLGGEQPVLITGKHTRSGYEITVDSVSFA